MAAVSDMPNITSEKMTVGARHCSLTLAFWPKKPVEPAASPRTAGTEHSDGTAGTIGTNVL